MAARNLGNNQTALTFDDLDGPSDDLRSVDDVLLERARLCVMGTFAWQLQRT